MRRIAVLAVSLPFVAATLASGPCAQSGVTGDTPALRPTNHPRLPADISQLWLAPVGAGRAPGAGSGRGSAAVQSASRSAAMTQFAEAVKLEVEANYARA